MSTPNGDKRSVTTDALETLGTIHTSPQHRDAIHLAVEPVIAGEDLEPGQHITVRGGKAYAEEVGKGLGIVDPFIAESIARGQSFWFVMYPRMVHSLRHVWTHPAFEDEVVAPTTTVVAPTTTAVSKEMSEAWLRQFVGDQSFGDEYGETYKAVMRSLDYIDEGDTYVHVSEVINGEIPAEFWTHAEVVTGKTFPNRPSHFSCSC